jgi:Holliday junction resolvase
MNRSQKGARLEREICNELVKAGWSVVRGAGSKSYGRGKIDLVAIHPKKHEIYLLQCKNYKNGGMTAGERERSELWQIFNPSFKESYSLRCGLVTSKRDAKLIDGDSL